MPEGFSQKGRSRFWYDDQAWRANFVDFQPSSWSKGTYCNVGVSWLWGPTAGVKGYWAFHISNRVSTESGQFISYEDDPSAFGVEVERLADRAVVEARAIRDRFSRLSALLDYYSNEAVRGWPGYHRAIALGLTGSGLAARDLFDRVAAEAKGSEIEWIRALGQSAHGLAEVAVNERKFRQVIEDRIREVRKTLHLPPLDHAALPASNDQ